VPKIRFKRGLKTNLPVLDEGEPAFTTDTEEFFIGSQTGNIEFAKQSDLDETNAQVTANTNSINNLVNTDTNAEVIDARSTYSTLGGRLDNLDSEVGTNTSQIESVNEQLADIMSCKQYGFVADYTGTPQYDGNDSTRITTTDNTTAFSKMLDDAKTKGSLRVYFPAGHYGIKVGNIIKDLSGCNLTIIGDGIDQTIIDFIHEDTSHTTYVDEDHANYIARITNINNCIISNLTLKATTNYGNLNDFQGDNFDYHGAVWGLIIENFNLLRCENVKVTQFNFRGITANNTKLGNGASTVANQKVELINCQGIQNRGSGFWIKFTKKLIIDGGEFAYNGLQGHVGTGYGVTASAEVQDVIIQGTPYFHHNYRKGLDTHTWCNLTVDSAVFEDNVLFDIAWLGYTGYTDMTSVTINIKGTFRHGDTDAGKAWLQSCYQAIVTRNDPGMGDERYTCIKIDDTTKPIVKLATIQCSLQTAYNGSSIIGDLVPYSWAFCLQVPVGELRIVNSNINLKDWTITGTTKALNACPFNIACTKIKISHTEITWLEDATFAGNYSCLFYGSITNMEIVYRFVTFNLNNCYIFCGINNNAIIDPGDSANTIRTLENVMFRWMKLPGNSDNRKLLGSQTSYARNFKNVSAYINGVYFNITPGIIYDYKFDSAAYGGHNATDFLQILIDNQPNYYTIEVWTYNNDYIKISNGSLVTDGTNITLDSITAITDTDGRAKLKVLLKTKVYVASSAHDNIEIKLKGSTATGGQISWGIESYTVL
jgi:hypothetical protein